MKIQSCEDLEIWQISMDLLVDVYGITASLPDCERFNLVVQMGKAAVSVPSNIAEGWGRGRGPSQANFLRIARGSLYELSTQLEATKRLGYISEDRAKEMKVVTNLLAKKLNSYMTWLEGTFVREELPPYGSDGERHSE